MSTILVTGAAGFIGREVARALSARGHIVDVCDFYDEFGRNAKYMPVDIRTMHGRGVENCQLSIQSSGIKCNGSLADSLLTGDFSFSLREKMYEFIVHCAAICDTRSTDSEKIFWTNYELVKNIVDSCYGSKIIFFSSAAVYGNRPCQEDSRDLNPQTPYALSKLAAERYLLNQDSSDFAIVRPFNVYGYGEITKKEQTRSIVFRMLDAFYNGRRLDVHSLKATRDFIDVRDVAESVCAMVDNWIEFGGGKTYNFGTGEAISIEGLLKMFKDVYGSSSIINTVRPPYKKDEYQSRTLAEFKNARPISKTRTVEEFINESVEMVLE